MAQDTEIRVVLSRYKETPKDDWLYYAEQDKRARSSTGQEYEIRVGDKKSAKDLIGVVLEEYEKHFEGKGLTPCSPPCRTEIKCDEETAERECDLTEEDWDVVHRECAKYFKAI